jgi:hypothetical protein
MRWLKRGEPYPHYGSEGGPKEEHRMKAETFYSTGQPGEENWRCQMAKGIDKEN